MGRRGGSLLMENSLYENLVALIKSKDRDSLEVGIQILLQDIDKETKAEVFGELLNYPQIVSDPELKEDIKKIFNQCSETIVKKRIKKL